MLCLRFRRPLQTKDLHHDFIVENIIGDQKVSGKSSAEYECVALLCISMLQRELVLSADACFLHILYHFLVLSLLFVSIFVLQVNNLTLHTNCQECLFFAREMKKNRENVHFT